MRSKNGLKVQKKCLVCNKVFYVHPYRKDAKTCSKPCSFIYKDKGKKVRYECKVCMTRFSSYKKGKYCSIKCRGIDSTGENHSRWMGGSWVGIRKIVLLKQDFTCQSCGLKDVEIMQVNHKLPKSKYPELARDIENLEVLCPNCHTRKTLISIRNNYKI